MTNIRSPIILPKHLRPLLGITPAEFLDFLRKRPNSEEPYFTPAQKPIPNSPTVMLFSDLLILAVLKLLKTHRLDKGIARHLREIFGDEIMSDHPITEDEREGKPLPKWPFKNQEDFDRFEKGPGGWLTIAMDWNGGHQIVSLQKGRFAEDQKIIKSFYFKTGKPGKGLKKLNKRPKDFHPFAAVKIDLMSLRQELWRKISQMQW